MEQFNMPVSRADPRVLVAEEDARLRRIVRVNLERAGFVALEAASLAECETALREGDVSLVILSSQLAGLESRQLSDWLRATFTADPMPTVILSFDPEDRLLSMPLGISEFSLKPFDPDELVGQVIRLMRVAGHRYRIC